MSNAEQPTVFIVDDDEAVRDALTLLMGSVGLATESFASAQAFLDQFDPRRSGCLVLDVRMPGINGLALAEQLGAQSGCVPILFISGHGDVPMAVDAMRLGAVDFLQKPFRDQDLLDRIFIALEQDRKRRDQLSYRQSVRERMATLTPRECEILEMLMDGKVNKVAAQELGLSQRTVEIHRARVMEKMGAASLAGLVQMVVAAR